MLEILTGGCGEAARLSHLRHDCTVAWQYAFMNKRGRRSTRGPRGGPERPLSSGDRRGPRRGPQRRRRDPRERDRDAVGRHRPSPRASPASQPAPHGNYAACWTRLRTRGDFGFRPRRKNAQSPQTRAQRSVTHRVGSHVFDALTATGPAASTQRSGHGGQTRDGLRCSATRTPHYRRGDTARPPHARPPARAHRAGPDHRTSACRTWRQFERLSSP